MADKGFTLRDLLSKISVGLNIPAFLNEKQFSAEDVGFPPNPCRESHWENKNFSHSPRDNPYLNGKANQPDYLRLCFSN